MARRKQNTELELQNAELKKQLTEMREKLDAAVDAKGYMQSRLANNTGTGSIYSELMVGIRNVSDYSVGIPSPISGDKDIQLAPDTSDDPATVDVITYAAWRILRSRAKVVKEGLVMRDDSILGSTYNAAPADLPTELPEEHKVNVIPDPVKWIESRTQTQLRKDIAKITSQASLFRLRRVVDQELGRLERESGMPRETREQQAKCAQYALRELDSKLALVDELTTSKLEAAYDVPIEGIDGNKINIKFGR